MEKIKPIAIYLPQFHPIPENDKWWGKGFTEWTNVTKAEPLFGGHYQPHLPADLGFYDLRLEEARMAQEAMAKEYGIYGFCYYHYWFNGKRLLHEPLNRKLQNPKEDLPFMMCWANENWTRTWDGLDKEVLIEQEYSFEDDLQHIEHLIAYFKDERYIKVDGKPVFIVYKPNQFADAGRTVELWRTAVKAAGFPDLYIGYALNKENNFEPKINGFDFAFEFQPNAIECPVTEQPSVTFLKKLISILQNKSHIPVLVSTHLVSYKNYVNAQLKKEFVTDVYPGITPMWDNSSRRKKDLFILNDSSPELYKKWLKHIRNNYPWSKMCESFIFINAWNEWAEGNHLEPCQKWGTKYLEVTKEILQ